MQKPSIGVIGTGAMGAPTAASLLAGGYATVVYDIDPARVEPLVNIGAIRAKSVLEVSDLADVVLVCLPTLEAIRQVVLGPEGVHRGQRTRICVNLSTIGPAMARELAAGLEGTRITFMDAPITGGTLAARDGTLSVTVSGDASTLQDLNPVLEQIAQHVYYIGPTPGQAQLMKLLNNMLSFAAFVAGCEAMILGAKAGLDPDVMIEIINSGTGRNSATTDKFPKNVLPRTFDYGAKMMISHKDMTLFLAEAERYGVPTWLAPVIKQVISFAITQGGPEKDISTLVQHYEKWCGIEISGAASRRSRLEG